MKQLLAFTAVLAFLLLGNTAATAQQKIAHINTDTIILRMDAYSSALANVQAYGQQLQKLLSSKEEQLKAYVQEVQTQIQMGEMTPKAQAEAEQKIQKMQSDLQTEALKADQNLSRREQDLLSPIYASFRNAMTQVAKAKGYAYILDQKSFLYLDGGEDATQEVADILGVDLSKPAVNAGGQPAAPSAGN